MGHADEAADDLTAAATFIQPQDLIACADQMDKAHALLMRAGTRYQDLFGFNITGVTEMIRSQVPIVLNINSSMLDEAVRLRNSG